MFSNASLNGINLVPKILGWKSDHNGLIYLFGKKERYKIFTTFKKTKTYTNVDYFEEKELNCL